MFLQFLNGARNFEDDYFSDFHAFLHEAMPIFAAAGVKNMSFRASIFIIVVLLKYLFVRVIDGLSSFL